MNGNRINAELGKFALDTLWRLAKTQNEEIALSCYCLLRKAYIYPATEAETEAEPEAKTEPKAEPRQATDEEIDSYLTLAEVAKQTRIYKQWLCNWATRHAKRMKMKGSVRLWSADAVQMAKDEYYGVSSRQATAKTKKPGKTSAETEAGMGEDKHTGGDDGKHRDACGQIDKGNEKLILCNGEPVYLSGAHGCKKVLTWSEAMRCTGLTIRQLDAVINLKEVIKGWIRIFPEE